MNMKHKCKAIIAALLAGLLLTLSACGESSAENITCEAGMPYGATISSKINKDKPSINYDARFVTEEMVNLVLDFYTAIQTKDGEKFSSLLLPLYHDYELTSVYGGKYTDQDIMNNTYDAISKSYEHDFIFSLVEITGFNSNWVEHTGGNLLPMLDDLSKKEDGTVFSDGLTVFCELTVTRYLAEADSDIHSETNTALKGEILYVLCHDGQWYLIYT